MRFYFILRDSWKNLRGHFGLSPHFENAAQNTEQPLTWCSWAVAQPGILFGRGQSLTSSEFNF